MENQVVLVTGAGSGMGNAVALLAAKRGASVVLADINLVTVQAVADEIISNGGEAIAIECDVSRANSVKVMIEQTVSKYGRLDAAFNNAGIMMPVTYIDEVSEALFDQVIDINLKGVWLCMKYQIAQMKQQGSGAIVNNSSIGGLVGGVGLSSYHAAKHGVLGLTKSAAVEYATHGIQINAVCPGTIETPMVEKMISSGKFSEQGFKDGAPIKRLGKATEVAEVVLWLFSPAASYVVGQPISVDGGLSII